MLFNSLHFLLFFPVFCFTYFAVAKKHQWKVLVAGGYYFYGNFSPFFAIILFVITCNDFLAGIMMDKESEQSKKKKMAVPEYGRKPGYPFYLQIPGFC
jgi:D-alanyl-lipoteichoic acid acyltransferase DltB (MBOAT superfamily)